MESVDGALLIAPDNDIDVGHPYVTGGKSARIAGEIKYNGRHYELNTKSGRYSAHYDQEDCNIYLNNAHRVFQRTFPNDTFEAIEYQSQKLTPSSSSESEVAS